MVEGCPLVPLCERAACDCWFDARLDYMVRHIIYSPEEAGAGKTMAWNLSVTLFPFREQQPRHPRYC